MTSHDLPSLIAHNPTLAHPVMVSLLSQPVIDTYIDVLRHLPPTLPTYDVLGRLLRDTTTVIDRTTGGTTTIADIMRSEVLGWFLHESILWLDNALQDERAGLISDDRFPKGVQTVRHLSSVFVICVSLTFSKYILHWHPITALPLLRFPC
jgi:hypothetical protein